MAVFSNIRLHTNMLLLFSKSSAAVLKALSLGLMAIQIHKKIIFLPDSGLGPHRWGRRSVCFAESDAGAECRHQHMYYPVTARFPRVYNQRQDMRGLKRWYVDFVPRRNSAEKLLPSSNRAPLVWGSWPPPNSLFLTMLRQRFLFSAIWRAS